MATRIPLVARPIEEDWHCKRSGDCCTKPLEVVMTREERVAILRALPMVAAMVKTEWRDIGENMVALKAAPCPFYLFNTCVVYSSRPFNCRRFACMRPDPATEPFELSAEGNCINFWERMAASRVVRRLAAKIQRKAQRWALAHGWTNEREDTSMDGADG